MLLWTLLFTLLSLLHAEYLSDGQDVGQYVQDHIHGADVMVFAKSYCPFCKKARQLLQDLHEQQNQDAWTLYVIDLDLLGQEDGPLIQMELLEQTGQKTVPNIFLGGRHIGGNAELQTMHQTGALQEELNSLSAA